MSTIIKILIVCIGVVTTSIFSIDTGSYWPLLITVLGLFGYLFCEFYVLRTSQKEGKENASYDF